MDGGFSAAFSRVILYVIVDEAGVVAEFQERRKREDGVSSAQTFADKQGEERPPAFTAAAKQVKSGQKERIRQFTRRPASCKFASVGKEITVEPVIARLRRQKLPQYGFNFLQPRGIVKGHTIF
jgi:hypothetical protein